MGYEHFELTEPQRSIWDTASLAEGLNDSITGDFSSKGELDAKCAEIAMNCLYRFSQVLRAEFVEIGGEPRQRFHDADSFSPGPLRVMEFAGREEYTRWVSEYARAGMDGKLSEITFFSFEDSFGLVGKFSHLICDGASVSIFIADIVRYYYDALDGIGQEGYKERSYQCLIDRERAYYGGSGGFQRDRRFWRERLAGYSAETRISGKAGGSFSAKRLAVSMDEGFEGRLDAYCASEGVSKFAVLYACYARCIAAHTGGRQATVMCAVANRVGAEERSVPGMFVNTVPVRFDIDGIPGETVTDWIRRSGREALNTLKRYRYSYRRIMQDRYEVSGTDAALTDVSFSYQDLGEFNKDGKDGYVEGIFATQWHFSGSQAENLILHARKDEGGPFSLLLDYREDMLDEWEAQAIGRHFAAMLRMAVEGGQAEAASLEVADEGEKALVLGEFGLGARTGHDRGLTLVDLFDAQAAETPGATALRYRGDGTAQAGTGAPAASVAGGGGSAAGSGDAGVESAPAAGVAGGGGSAAGSGDAGVESAPAASVAGGGGSAAGSGDAGVESAPAASVAGGGGSMTYGELAARAGRLAWRLRGLGVGPGDHVAIASGRGMEAIVGILGVLKAGGAYVPIDPAYPQARVKHMIEDSAPKAVLVYGEGASLFGVAGGAAAQGEASAMPGGAGAEGGLAAQGEAGAMPGGAGAEGGTMPDVDYAHAGAKAAEGGLAAQGEASAMPGGAGAESGTMPDVDYAHAGAKAAEGGLAALCAGMGAAVLDLGDPGSYADMEGAPPRLERPEDLAYIIYTSGTTGRPKGVMIEHRGAVNLREYFRRCQPTGGGDTVLQFASLAFDAHVSELLLSIFAGASLLMCDIDGIMDVGRFKDVCREEGVSALVLPPHFLGRLGGTDARIVISAGSEAMSESISALSAGTSYSNDYGPTEATVCATHWGYRHGDPVPGTVPIGRPICNKSVYILDGMGLCGIGVPGELCIGGEGLARGYLNQPALTAEKFV
ncbi:MAG: AMP-binding protein, partial [Clostridiales Family XIII bacterium]|nr:AMP-binding protein [Clostridiales Family XIII bacterium]